MYQRSPPCVLSIAINISMTGQMCQKHLTLLKVVVLAWERSGF